MTPIRCSQEDIQTVQQVFPCRIQEFPTKYLGAPLFLSRLGHADERIVDAVAARIPTWKGGLMTYAGRAKVFIIGNKNLSEVMDKEDKQDISEILDQIQKKFKLF